MYYRKDTENNEWPLNNDKTLMINLKWNELKYDLGTKTRS